MTVHPRGQIGLDLVNQRVGGQGQDRGPGQVLGLFGGADRPGRLDAVHDRHLDIHEDQVEPAAPPGRDRFAAVRDNLQMNVQRLQDGLQDLLVGGVVLRRQDPQAASVLGFGLRLGRLGHCRRNAPRQRQVDDEG